VRLGLTLLVLSRPRPVQNLFVFWLGCLTGAIPPVVIPLTLLHVTPMSTSFGKDSVSPGTHSTVGYVQIGIGVFALSIAMFMTVRLVARQRAQLATLDSNTSTREPDSNRPSAISRLLDPVRDPSAENGSAFRRLFGRARNSWASGSLWVAFVIGMVFGGPPPGEAVFLFAIIATSGAEVGATISAAVVYLVGMLSIIEVMLVGYLITPAKTHEALRLLHDWVSAHRRKILIAIFTVVGVTLVARGVLSV